MGSTCWDGASQENLQVCEWRTMRCLSGTNGRHEEMEAARESSVSIRHAEYGTNQILSTVRRMQIFAQQYFFQSVHRPQAPYSYASAKGSRRCSVQLVARLAWFAPIPVQFMWTLAGFDILMWPSAWLCMPLVGIWLRLSMGLPCTKVLAAACWLWPGLGWAYLVLLRSELKSRTAGI